MVMDFATINRDGVVMLYGCCKNPGLKSLWLGRRCSPLAELNHVVQVGCETALLLRFASCGNARCGVRITLTGVYIGLIDGASRENP